MSCNSCIFVPIGEGFLHFSGVICSENVLRDGTAINQSCRAALEGDTLYTAVSVGCSLHGIIVGIGKVCYAKSFNILCCIGIGVLDDVVGLSKEHIDFFVIGSICLIKQSFIESCLISTAVIRNNDPVYGDAFGNFVVLLKEAFELLVPCVNVEDFAFFCGCADCTE